MLTPHLATHHGSVIGAVANSNDRSVINQMRYLLAVMFVSRGEVDSSQLPFGVDGHMELETVVAALPVIAKASYGFSYFMSVGSHQLTDMQHGRVHKPERCILHQELIIG